MPDEKSDLEILTNAPTDITLGGKRLSLTPLRFGELGPALKLVKPVLGLLRDGTVDLFELMIVEGDRLLDLAALLSRQPVAWVRQLPADDAVRLVGALYEVNADFFARRVLPAVAAQLQAINRSLDGQKPTTTPPTTPETTTASGSTASAASSEPDTDGQTS